MVARRRGIGRKRELGGVGKEEMQSGAAATEMKNADNATKGAVVNGRTIQQPTAPISLKNVNPKV